MARLEEARSLPSDISASEFLREFPNGGAIFRIFWLHCWHPRRFPVYDQHVHRAMSFICGGRIAELNDHEDDEKIRLYTERYIPFFSSFASVDLPFDLSADGTPERKADRALFAFGKAIAIPNGAASKRNRSQDRQ